MDREKVIHAVETAFDVWIDEYTGCSCFKEDKVRQAKEDALELLKEQETANLYKCPNCGTWVSAENVVRCKDCKHTLPKGFCHKHSRKVADDWFCADGERKQEDD